MNFIRKYLGRGLTQEEDLSKVKNIPKPSSVPGVSAE